MPDVLTPFTHAIRSLRSTPATTALAIGTMAAAIGANAAVFTVVNATVLRGLPFPAASQLVLVTAEFPRMHLAGMGLSGPEVVEFPGLTRAFSSSGPVLFDTATIVGRTEPVRAPAAYLSAAALDTLGTQALIGRSFTAEEDRPNGPRAALLGHALWVRAFGSDPAVVGRPVTIDGRTHTIAGVMPEGFDLLGSNAELWLPLRLDATNAGPRADHRYRLIARVRDHVTMEQARGDLLAATASWQRATGQVHAPDPRMHPLALTPLLDASVGTLRGTMLLMLGAVGFVLLMACANVSNLLLAKAESRRHELAVRLALGASRLRLLRDHFVEGVCLASMGSLAGLLLAAGLLRVLLARVVTLPRLEEVHVDGDVLLFTVALTAASAILFGVAPVMRLDATRAYRWLKGDGRGTTLTRDRQRLQRALVAVEVALALILLAGAGLMLRGVWRLAHVDPGFDTRGVVAMEVSLPSASYASNEQVWAFYEQLVERIRASGATQAGVMSGSLPLRRANNTTFFLDGMTTLNHESMPQVEFVQHVSEGTFATLGMTLVAGRPLRASDRETAPAVAVVNETLAKKFWPGQDPIGRRLRAAIPTVTWFTVVGVVRDVRQAGLHAPAGTEVYVTHRQAKLLLSEWVPRDVTIVAKADAARLPELTRRLPALVHDADPSLALSGLTSMDAAVGRTIAEPRATALLLSGFAAAAILLAAIGIYGVMSFSVGQRAGEFAVRIALGATPASVVRLVVGQASLPIAAGLAIGYAGAVATTRLLRSLLFEITPTDPPTFAGALLFLVSVALAACWIPARRATRTDPITALRNV